MHDLHNYKEIKPKNQKTSKKRLNHIDHPRSVFMRYVSKFKINIKVE